MSIAQKARVMMKDLSASQGGSLVKQIRKAALSQSHGIVYVGLGGLGCKTVNIMKKIYEQEFSTANNVAFLAVDTALDDLAGLTHLRADEKFPVYDDSAINLLITPPPEIQEWIPEGFKQVPITSTGAQQTRLIGRVMLCGTQKYWLLRNKIDNLVNAVRKPGGVCIMLVAGISGGTGSGTFIDVSYMLRDICEQYNAVVQKSVMSYGTFYTADVQRSIPAIGNNPTTWANVTRNCYAALKELDYFMNVKEGQVDGKPVYHLRPVAAGGLQTEVTSYKAIFEPGQVFIVSETTAIRETDKIIEMTAKALLNMHRAMAVAGPNPPQSFLSHYSNVSAQITTWELMHAGAHAAGGGAVDPCGIENTEYPVHMNYIYSSLGQSEIYIPRDEIMVYCANMVMQEILKIWNNYKQLTQEKINEFANYYGIASLDQIHLTVKNMMNLGPDALKIPEDSYPDARTFIGVGRATGLEDTIKYASEAVDRLIKGEKGNIVVYADTIFRTIQSSMEDVNTVAAYGPFYMLALLSGVDGTPLVGFRKMLEILYQQAAKGDSRWHVEEQNARTAMEAARVKLANDNTPSRADVQKYVDACETYAEAYLNKQILVDLCGGVIMNLFQVLTAYNNETFEIYVPILNELTAMLNESSMIFAQGNTVLKNSGKTFGMDALGLAKSQAACTHFQNVFAGMISPEMVADAAQAFANSMLGAESRAKWQQYVTAEGASSALNDEIRNIFAKTFGTLCTDTLEKLMVLAYTDNNTMTAAQLDTYWNSTNPAEQAICENAIYTAAAAIAQELTGQCETILRYEAPARIDELDKSQYVIMPDMKTLLPQIQANLGMNVNVSILPDDAPSFITYMAYSYPAALPLVYNMSEYAGNYVSAAAQGRHMEENLRNWPEELPEIYGADTEDYWTVFRKNTNLSVGSNALQTDRAMYGKIREAVEDGLAKGYICWDAAKGQYQLLKITGTRDGYASVYKAFRANPAGGLACALCSRDPETGAPQAETEYAVIPLVCRSNKTLLTKANAVPNTPYKLKNLYRIIRMDMRLQKAVQEAQIFYGNNTILEELEVIRKDLKKAADFDTNLTLFAEMLMAGLIRFNAEGAENLWEFKCINTPDNRNWNMLFNFRPNKQELDVDVALYLAFAGGFCNTDCVTEDHRSVIQVLMDNLNQQGLLSSDDCKARAMNWLANVNGVTEKWKLSSSNTILIQETCKELEKNYKFSSYKEAYDMPETVKDGKDIYSNLKKFYESIIPLLNVR